MPSPQSRTQIIQAKDNTGFPRAPVSRPNQNYVIPAISVNSALRKTFHFNFLFVSQRDQRVHFRSPPRRNVASQQRYSDEQQRHPDECQRIGRRHP
jgi:hypothetical protein